MCIVNRVIRERERVIKTVNFVKKGTNSHLKGPKNLKVALIKQQKKIP